MAADKAPFAALTCTAPNARFAVEYNSALCHSQDISLNTRDSEKATLAVNKGWHYIGIVGRDNNNVQTLTQTIQEICLKIKEIMENRIPPTIILLS